MPSAGLPWTEESDSLPAPREEVCMVCGGLSGAESCFTCSELHEARMAARERPTIPIPPPPPDPYEEDGAPETIRSLDMFEGTLIGGGFYPSWEDAFANMPGLLTTWDDVLLRIEELKAGDTPRNQLETAISSAIERNRKRDAEEAAAQDALPSRFERV